MNTRTLIWRNLWRNRVRTILTILAVAFSIFLVCAVLDLPSVRDAMIEQSAGGLRLVVQHDAGLTYWLPLAHAQHLQTIPHVAGVNHWTYFGGIYSEPKEFFPSFAIDPETVTAVWPDYDWDPEVLDTFQRMRNGALVGPLTMKKFGWKIGDEITLRNGILNLSLSFRIVGIIPPQARFSSTSLWFSRRYLEEAAERVGGWDFVTLLWARVDAPEHINPVMAAIDDFFRNSEAETATQAEHAFIASFLGSVTGLMWIIMLVGGVVVIAVVLIAANTAAMSMRERTAEVSVLRTIGFRTRTIFAMALSEGLLIAGTGGILGAGVAYLILGTGEGGWSSFLGPLSLFAMPLSVVIQGVLLSLLVGILASLIPARAAARLNIVAGLRQIV